MDMNEVARQQIRDRMAELGYSQEKLAEKVNGRREGRAQNKGTVTRHALSRAINHGGEIPPLLADVLDELGLEVVLRAKP